MPPTTRELPSPSSQIETVDDLKQYLLASNYGEELVNALDLDQLMLKFAELRQYRFTDNSSGVAKIKKEIRKLLAPLFPNGEKRTKLEGTVSTGLINSIRAVFTSNDWFRRGNPGLDPHVKADEQHHKG